jgi:hypothetical protein
MPAASLPVTRSRRNEKNREPSSKVHQRPPLMRVTPAPLSRSRASRGRSANQRGAPGAAAHFGDACRAQPIAGQLRQVGQPPSVAIGPRPRDKAVHVRRCGIGPEGCQYVSSDFELTRPDAGTQPRHQLIGRAAGGIAHRGHGAFDHAGRQAPPAGVGSANDASIATAQQDRKAVGDQHHAADAGLGREAGIGAMKAVAGRQVFAAQPHDLGAVHLVQPHRLGPQRRGEAALVRRHRGRLVDHVARQRRRPQVQAGKGRRADATFARAHQRANMRRCRPVRTDCAGQRRR